MKIEMNGYGKEPLACKCLGVDLVNAKAAAAVSDCSWAWSPGVTFGRIFPAAYLVV